MRSELNILMSMALLAEILACTPSRPQLDKNPTTIVAPRLDSSQLLDIRGRIDRLVVAKSEEEVWQNTLQMAPLTYEAYCRAFTGCTQPSPKVEILSLADFTTKFNTDIHNSAPFTNEDLLSYLASTLTDRTILINKGHPTTRLTIETGEFTNLASNMPAILMEEQFHADRQQASPINWIADVGKGSFNFTSVRGFGLEMDDNFAFTWIEEAASIVAVYDLQRTLGIRSHTPAVHYQGIAGHLSRKMQSVRMGAGEMVELHRSNSLDPFLAKLYPHISDADQRRLIAVTEFNTVYHLTNPKG